MASSTSFFDGKPDEFGKPDPIPEAEAKRPNLVPGIPDEVVVSEPPQPEEVLVIQPANLEAVMSARLGCLDEWVIAEPTKPQAVVIAAPIPGPPHPGFWWSLVWCVAFMLVMIGSLLVVLIATIVFEALASGDPQAYVKRLSELEVTNTNSGDDTGEAVTRTFQISSELARVMGPSYFGAEVVSVLFALLVIRLVVGRDWKRKLALRRPSLSHLVLVLVGFPAFLILPGLIHELAKMLLGTLIDQKGNESMFGSWPLWFAVLTIGLGPGIGEELWCRGFLGRGLVGRYGPVGGVVLTSCLFGMLHIDPAYAVATAFMGMCLHFVYLTSRSLLLPMLLHTLNNSMAILQATLSQGSLLGAAAAEPGQEPGTLQGILRSLDQETNRHMALVFGAAILLAGTVAWAMYRSRVRLIAARGNDSPAWQPHFPGVEYPPADSGTVVVRPWPGWLASVLVLAAAGTFILSLAITTWLAEEM